MSIEDGGIKEPSFSELLEETILPPKPVRKSVSTKTRCKRCATPITRDTKREEYHHIDEGWRSQKLHGHYAEPRYERNATT